MRDGICELAGLVIKRNIIESDEQLYLQQSGTAIGTKMAPNFSNTSMHELEQKFLTDVPHKPSVWWRFFGDIFTLWQWGVDELHEFMNRLIFVHPTVKFTYNFSTF